MSLSLHRFLSASSSFVQKWIQSNNHILNVVIGNQAADADSIIGSLVYSYMLYSKYSSESEFYIPLVHIAKEKLPLRSEVMHLFSLVGIDYHSIMTVQEFQKYAFQSSNRIHFHLVDHNVLSPSLHRFEECITEIIDHRKDEGLYPQAKRHISYDPAEGKGVGSCCTLLGELLQQWSLPQNLSECSLLLEGVVLLDTLNLSPSINKTTQQDRAIVPFLQQQHSSIPLSQTDLFEQLANAKYDPIFWSSISLQDALDYDFKVFRMGTSQIGWSAVLTSLHTFVDDKHFDEIVRCFCEERLLDGLIVSAVIAGEPIRREFHVICKAEMREKMEWTLLEKYQCEKDGKVLFTYSPISRKALAPVLMKFCKNMETSLHELINQSIDAVSKLKDVVNDLGRNETDPNKKDYRNIRKSKLLLLQLKESSRTIFGTLQNTSNSIDEAMTNSDKVLTGVKRLESEISRLKNKINYYKSFSTPQYDSVINNSEGFKYDESNEKQSRFDQQMEFLSNEIDSRKRLREQLDEKIRAKEQCFKEHIQLKHHNQNVVAQKLSNIGEVIQKASDSILEGIVKDEEDEKGEESDISPMETCEPPEASPKEE